MHEQWEYQLLTGCGRKRIMKSEDGVEHGSFNQELLNSLGKDGWEVCGGSVSG